MLLFLFFKVQVQNQTSIAQLQLPAKLCSFGLLDCQSKRRHFYWLTTLRKRDHYTKYTQNSQQSKSQISHQMQTVCRMSFVWTLFSYLMANLLLSFARLSSSLQQTKTKSSVGGTFGQTFRFLNSAIPKEKHSQTKRSFIATISHLIESLRSIVAKKRN